MDWKKIQAILPESAGKTCPASKKGAGKGSEGVILTLLPAARMIKNNSGWPASL